MTEILTLISTHTKICPYKSIENHMWWHSEKTTTFKQVSHSFLTYSFYSKGFTALLTLKDHLSANGVLWMLMAILIESTRIVSRTFRKSPLSTVQPLLAKEDRVNRRQSRTLWWKTEGENILWRGDRRQKGGDKQW